MYALCFGARRSRALTLDGVSDTLDGPEIVHDVEEGLSLIHISEPTRPY